MSWAGAFLLVALALPPKQLTVAFTGDNWGEIGPCG